MADLEDDLRALLKDCIAKVGLSQAHVARQLDVTQKHLSQMLTGRAPLSITWAVRIAKVCGRDLRVTSRRQRRPATVPDQPQEQSSRQWIAQGRRSAASEIRSAILDVLHPDDPPAREHAIRECIGIAERHGALEPIPVELPGASS